MEKFLVTGASGYIASWIVRYLLEKGEMVHGTVRSLSDTKKISHLLEMQQQFPGQLVLFEADLLDKESFRKPMEGCTRIIHTASPFIVSRIKDPHRDLILPAVEGTANILGLAKEFSDIKRIVVTSSVAAIYCDSAEARKPGIGIFSEEQWNTACNEKHNPYSYSKTLAEKKAWEMLDGHGRWKLATINPGFVLGPSLSRRVDSTSIDMMRNLINGRFKMGVPDLYFGVVDVRDVARAHILAATKEEASGRHILVNDTFSLLEISKILGKRLPQLPVAKSLLPDFLLYMAGPVLGFSWRFLRQNLGISITFDNTRSRALGVEYRPIEDTLADHAMQLINDKIV